MARTQRWVVGSAGALLAVFLLPRPQIEAPQPRAGVERSAPPVEAPERSVAAPAAPAPAAPASPVEGAAAVPESPSDAPGWRPRWFDPEARAARFGAFLQRQLDTETLTPDEATALRDVRASAARDMADLRAQYRADRVGLFEAAFTGWGILQGARSRAKGIIGADRLDALRADARAWRDR